MSKLDLLGKEMQTAFDSRYEARFGGLEENQPRLRVRMGHLKIEDWEGYCTINDVRVDVEFSDLIALARKYLGHT